MSKSKHPIEQEELMAYLDGELATDRAVETAVHMEHCAECQELAADLRKLSQEMMAWEVEGPVSEGMSTDVVVALEKKGKEPRKEVVSRWSWRGLFRMPRLAWAGGSAVIVLLVSSALIINGIRYQPLPDTHKALIAPSALEQVLGYDSRNQLQNNSTTNMNGLVRIAPGISGGVPRTRSGAAAEQESGDDEIDTSDRTVPSAPMIARTADLTLRTKEFEKTRAGLEETLKRHGGYLGELKVSAPADSGRALTATLRIPAAQFDAAMAELKGLGRVEFESQGGEEVTQQYVDLQARLANGRHTEQRLTEILRQRTGKLQEVLKVELEIDRVRGEIEQMQAEKKELSKRVAFATLNTTVKEEYFAKLQATPPSTGSRFSNAAVDGYNTAVEGLISVGLFLLSSGPSLLIWAAVLFFPVRWLWKRLKKAYVSRRHGDTEEEKAE
jgi:uncharacterized protein DUF4349/putative zinc finger protein